MRERIRFWLRALAAGLDPVDMLSRLIAAAVLLLGIAGFTVKLVFHLPWLVVVVILMGIVLAVFAEGAYRVNHRLADDRTAKLAEQQSQHQLALDAQRQDYEKKLAKAQADSVSAKQEPPPFELRHYARKAPLAGGRVTSHYIRVTNRAGQPERRAHVTAEFMAPYPRKKSAVGVDPAFPHAVPPESGGTAAAGLVIGPGQEQSWFIGYTWTRPDGKISVYEFFSDTGADWELGPGEHWRISYLITCDGVTAKPFSIVIEEEKGEAAVSLQG
ncbi:MAG: hypothetical protein ACRDOU_17290 [Streptosporangiaceae bacterium]